MTLVGRMVIGRDPMCDVSENDPLLSRRHAEFVDSGSDVVVRDLGSRNGILVNGVKQPQAVLQSGDVVQIGHLQFKYVDRIEPGFDDGDADSHATAVAAPRFDPEPAAPSRAPAPPVAVAAPQQSPPPASRRAEFDPTGSGRRGSPDLDPTVPTVRRPLTTASRHGSNVQTFVAPGGRVRFDMPADDWQVVSGGTAAIVSLAQRNGEAAVVVEAALLVHALGPDDITDRFAHREADVVQEQQPGAIDVVALVGAFDARRVAVVTYSRAGVAGPERVWQFSIPGHLELYRITCSAASPLFARYETVFARVAATFAIGAHGPRS
jgi:predicted component of type VI protein secretion system